MAKRGSGRNRNEDVVHEAGCFQPLARPTHGVIGNRQLLNNFAFIHRSDGGAFADRPHRAEDRMFIGAKLILDALETAPAREPVEAKDGAFESSQPEEH